MPVRIKKLVGLILMLIWIFFYVLFAMRLAAAVLPDSHWVVQLGFYAFAGIAWIIPAGFLIEWMSSGGDPDAEL